MTEEETEKLNEQELEENPANPERGESSDNTDTEKDTEKEIAKQKVENFLKNRQLVGVIYDEKSGFVLGIDEQGTPKVMEQSDAFYIIGEMGKTSSNRHSYALGDSNKDENKDAAVVDTVKENEALEKIDEKLKQENNNQDEKQKDAEKNDTGDIGDILLGNQDKEKDKNNNNESIAETILDNLTENNESEDKIGDYLAKNKDAITLDNKRGKTPPPYVMKLAEAVVKRAQENNVEKAPRKIEIRDFGRYSNNYPGR